MDKMIAKFSSQLREAVEIGNKSQISRGEKEYSCVYVAGLGGSGIGANFVAEFIRDECRIPYLVGKGYEVPAFVGPSTLAICSSYSGNTEETLAAYDAIKAQGARIIVISGGGKLIEKARADGYDFILVPGDWASPRACLGYSLVQQLAIMVKLGYVDTQIHQKIISSANLIDKESEDIKSRAEMVARMLHNRTPVIYTTDRMEAVAIRFRQQINENAKRLCWHHVIPEMNHNELVGWRVNDPNIAVVIFRNSDDLARNQLRIDINKDLIRPYAGSIIELYSKGENLVEKAMYLVHLGDWISWYLSQLNGVDAIEVDVIDKLKSELSKFNF